MIYYYIFKVRTNKPDIIKDYYILNNRYISYVGFDCQHIRSIIEHNAGLKYKFQLYATLEIPGDYPDLHRMFCESLRFDRHTAKRLAEQYSMIRHKSLTWYENHFPNKGDSRSYLRESPLSKDRTLKTIKGV